MSTFETTLLAREEVAERTMAFHFAKPAGFDFTPGQAIEVALSGDLRHAFSIVTAPFEPRLTIATRMRDSAFKRALGSLPVGAHVTMDGPFGSLALPADRSVPAVLIAGGIGITPFVSMLRQAAHERSPRPLTLIYSNRRPEDAPFLDELRRLEQQCANFKLVATMTQAGTSRLPWTGETGPIDEALLKKAVGDLGRPIFYVVGPPAMVEAVQGTLRFAGVEPGRIVTEEFYGY
ncbi:MAG: FAD-dependent oxidoreductase [Pseudomonadota bacterium]